MNLIAMLMLAADPSAQPLPDIVLLDFTAGYCQPCQQMVPVLQRMEKAGYPIRKIDIGEHPELSRQHKVDVIPTLILMVDGKEAERFVGITAEQELRHAMLDAKERWKIEHRTAEPNSSTATIASTPANQSTTSEPASAAVPKSGIRGVIDRMKQGLAGAGTASRDNLERPDFRAQSPDEAMPAITNDTLPMEATVRVRLDEGEFKDVGTGTIIHSTTGQSTILTCAHIFKDFKSNANLEVEVFRNGQTLKYAATVLGGDHDSDLAFLRIKNSSPLPMAPLQQGELNLKPEDPVFSIGCNGGKMPTQLGMKVKKVKYFEGPENILCTVDPVQGRSGGGLFNVHGELVGVCSGAFRESKEGLYTGIGAVRQLMTGLRLNSLFECEVPGFASESSNVPAKTASFEKDVDPFEQMFEESAESFGDETSPAELPSSPPPSFDSTPPGELSDPFASAMTAGIATDAEGTMNARTEITVIIDSKDPQMGKRVVVIPQATPFLLHLLTGQSPQTSSELVTAGQSSLSTTSSRSGVRELQRRRQPSRPVYRSRDRRNVRAAELAPRHRIEHVTTGSRSTNRVPLPNASRNRWLPPAR